MRMSIAESGRMDGGKIGIAVSEGKLNSKAAAVVLSALWASLCSLSHSGHSRHRSTGDHPTSPTERPLREYESSN